LSLADALAPLASLRQFIVARIDPTPKPEAPWKTNKVPLNPVTLFAGDAHDPSNWLDASAAYDLASRMGPRFGVGFVITANDPVWCLDIDNCLMPDGTWSPVAQQLCAAFPGAAVELSDSRHGLHIWGCGRAPAHGMKNTAWSLEFYTERRFILLGRDRSASGSVATDHTAMLANVVAAYFPAEAIVADGEGDLSDAPVPEWRGPTDDEDLIRRALRTATATTIFGNKASFTDLWECNVPKLAAAFPSATGDQFDRSAADSALAFRLAFWTGNHGERVERLMRRSGLYREKWDDRGDYYINRTVNRACSGGGSVCVDKPPAQRTGPDVATDGTLRPKPVSGATILSGDQVADQFEGCCYVSELHQALIPGGRLLKPEQFKVQYGGRSYPMDMANGKLTRDAWEAFTQSQIFECPRVDATCFRPDLAPGAMVSDGMRTAVNAWWPARIERAQGDPALFLELLRKLLPDERDRSILINYMASLVQNQGKKFRWAPVLQGVEGNGKSLLSMCVTRAVGRQYTHWPDSSSIANKFNAWMENKVFYAVEDIYVGESQVDVIERLKPMITGTTISIEGKNKDQVSREVCGNFIFNTNHKTGLRKTRNDRRFCVFYTAQQEYQHLERDGLTPAFFGRLLQWLERENGFAIVADMLYTWPISPALDPAGACQRAPDSSTTGLAIEHGLGAVEQEIMEAVANEETGFRGGWISSHFLHQLLVRTKSEGKVPRNRRREVLAALGYRPHPWLEDGRVNGPVMPDGAKPTLYVKDGHSSAVLTSPVEIARAYSQAQGDLKLPSLH
jgi:Family of unknown function (DUF5906)